MPAGGCGSGGLPRWRFGKTIRSLALSLSFCIFFLRKKHLSNTQINIDSKNGHWSLQDSVRSGQGGPFSAGRPYPPAPFQRGSLSPGSLRVDGSSNDWRSPGFEAEATLLAANLPKAQRGACAMPVPPLSVPEGCRGWCGWGTRPPGLWRGQAWARMMGEPGQWSPALPLSSLGSLQPIMSWFGSRGIELFRLSPRGFE